MIVGVIASSSVGRPDTTVFTGVEVNLFIGDLSPSRQIGVSMSMAVGSMAVQSQWLFGAAMTAQVGSMAPVVLGTDAPKQTYDGAWASRTWGG